MSHLSSSPRWRSRMRAAAPAALAIAVLGWIATEAGRFAAPQRTAHAELRVRARDVLMVALAVIAAASIVATG